MTAFCVHLVLEHQQQQLICQKLAAEQLKDMARGIGPSGKAAWTVHRSILLQSARPVGHPSSLRPHWAGLREGRGGDEWYRHKYERVIVASGLRRQKQKAPIELYKRNEAAKISLLLPSYGVKTIGSFLLHLQSVNRKRCCYISCVSCKEE